MDALKLAIELPDSLREDDHLGKIVLTSSETWVEPSPDVVFLGGGDGSIGVNVVHPKLQNDPETLSALRELGIRPLSPEIAFREGIAKWSSDRSDPLYYGPMTRSEYQLWMDKNWELTKRVFPKATLQQLQGLPRGNWSSALLLASEFLENGLTTPPEYEAWTHRYWTMFWDVARDLDPDMAATIIRESGLDWQDVLRVQTVVGQWTPLGECLLPGPVVSC